MNTHCPTCGKPLAPDAPMGLCPECLMNAGFGTVTGNTGEGAPAQPLSPEELAPHFPQLEILALLGRGGMGVVYKARQRALNRMVALKILAPERVRDPQFAGRFAREAQALAQLDHPHIVTIYDFGQAGGFYFLLMEFVDGANLRQLLQTRKLAPEEALAIVPPLCEALQFAHDRGIIHRDIKPENLLLDKNGQIKIADFGIAKLVAAGRDRRNMDEEDQRRSQTAATADLTEAGKIMGTPSYMAPEQTEHPDDVDSRADIYSLGVVFYEMLTGELPKDKIVPPTRKVQIDVRLDEVVLRALERSPDLRWQTAVDMKTQVETIAADPGSARVPRAVSGVPAGNIPTQPGEAANPSGFTGRNLPGSPVQGQPPGMSSAAKIIAIGCGVLLSLLVQIAAALPLMAIGLFIVPKFQVFFIEANTRLPDLAVLVFQVMGFLGQWLQFEVIAAVLLTWAVRHWGGTKWLRRWTACVVACLFAMFVAAAAAVVIPTTLFAPQWIQGKSAKSKMPSPVLDHLPRPATGASSVNEHQEQEMIPSLEDSRTLSSSRRSIVVRRDRERQPHYIRGVEEDLVTAMRAGDDAAMKANACDLIAGWRDALPVFAKELRGKLQELAGTTEPLEKIDTIFEDYDFRAVKTAMLEKAGTCLILFFAKTPDGWRNWTLRNAPMDANLKDCLSNEVAALDGSLKKRANSFVDLLAAGKFTEATAQFAAVMRDAMPEAKLAEVWHQLETSGGKFLGADPATRVERKAEFFCVYVPCRWERNRLDLKVVFDLAGKVSGLWVVPAEKNEAAASKGPASPAEKAAVSAAEAWLAGIDAGAYAQSWKDAHTIVQGTVTEQSWGAAMEKFRKPLGALVSRKLKSAQSAASFPRAIGRHYDAVLQFFSSDVGPRTTSVLEGNYVVIQFDTSFAAKKSAVEAVTLRLDINGEWKAARYCIQ